jgi:2-polyprenyl-3-methyl-5-hydroxy-6-metoxy-1,4-benzoquinol methylase
MAEKSQMDFYDNFLPHFEEQANNSRNVGWRIWVRKWVKPDSKVLDLGCSFGYNSEYLVRELSCKVFGIDISPKCIATAQKRYPHGTWHCGDITEGYDVGERDFNFVFMSDVIEHVPATRRPIMLTKAAEWLQKGGVLMASVPNAELHEQIVNGTYQPVEEQVWIGQLIYELHNAGLRRIVSLYLDGGVYYRLIAQKV